MLSFESAKSRSGIVFFVLSATVLACGDSSSSQTSEGEGGEKVEVEDLCGAVTDGTCTVLTECYSETFEYRDFAHCKEDQFCSGIDRIEGSIEAGWTTYDAQAMGDCMTRIREHPCDYVGWWWIPGVEEILLYVCPEVLEGQQRQGESCLSSADCLPQGYCSFEDYTCPGSCRDYVKIGDSCKAGDVCGGLYGDEWWAECIDGVCTLGGKVGEPCQAPGDFDLCEPGLECNGGTDLCIEAPTEGELCGYYDIDCAEGLFCDQPAFADNDEPGKCRVPGVEGAPCEEDDDDYCATGLRCIVDLCRLPSEGGEICKDHDDCELDFFCDHSTKLCAERKNTGEPCTEDRSCKLTHRCAHGGLCDPKLYVGDDCTADPSACSESLCEDGKCVARRKNGESCTRNSDCITRTCDLPCDDGTCEGVCVDAGSCEHLDFWGSDS